MHTHRAPPGLCFPIQFNRGAASLYAQKEASCGCPWRQRWSKVGAAHSGYHTDGADILPPPLRLPSLQRAGERGELQSGVQRQSYPLAIGCARLCSSSSLRAAAAGRGSHCRLLAHVATLCMRHTYGAHAWSPGGLPHPLTPSTGGRLAFLHPCLKEG